MSEETLDLLVILGFFGFLALLGFTGKAVGL